MGLDGRVASLVLVDVASVLAAELATHGRCRYIGGRALIGRCGSQWLYTWGNYTTTRACVIYLQMVSACVLSMPACSRLLVVGQEETLSARQLRQAEATDACQAAGS